jgi:hypothetical protein
MKKLIIHRKKRFSSSLMPFWIITDISKSDFMREHQISDDISCDLDWTGQPAKRADFYPNDYGIKIANGETLELDIEDDVCSVFAVSVHGLLSNEVLLDSKLDCYTLELSTKGGFSKPSYPVFIV